MYLINAEEFLQPKLYRLSKASVLLENAEAVGLHSRQYFQ